MRVSNPFENSFYKLWKEFLQMLHDLDALKVYDSPRQYLHIIIHPGNVNKYESKCIDMSFSNPFENSFYKL